MSLALRAAAPLRILTPCRRLHTTSSLFSSSKASSDPFSIPPAPPTGQTVDLAFEHHAPPPSSSSTTSTSCKSLVIAHGLFGSKQNWRSLSRSLASKLNLPVYAVDLRNHGTSPHIDSGMSYKDMAADLLRFIRSQNLSKVALVGHSMGGKAVMATALDESLKEGELESMVSVDMSPARGALSEQFEKYMEAMIDINKKGCNDRKHADEMLKETESVSRRVPSRHWDLKLNPSPRIRTPRSAPFSLPICIIPPTRPTSHGLSECRSKRSRSTCRRLATSLTMSREEGSGREGPSLSRGRRASTSIVRTYPLPT